MTLRLSILFCLILSRQILSSQVPAIPPETPQQFVASITAFWPGEPVTKTIQFSLPTKLTIQTSTDLQNWTDYAPAVVTFTATNNGTQQFFRLSREVRFKIEEIVSVPNYLPGNEWMAAYNIPNGYYIALLDEHGMVTRIVRNAKSISLADNEVEGYLVRQWRDEKGNEL